MSVDAETAPRSRRWLMYLPLAVFAALAWLLFVRLNAGDPASIPSALIGQSAPPLTLPSLDGAAGLTDADLRSGHVSVVNIFASWCEPCHYEHELLMTMGAPASTGGSMACRKPSSSGATDRWRSSWSGQ